MTYKEETRKLLSARQKWRLCAAAEVAFAQHGGKTTVRDILSIACMSRRSFYEFFSSVDDIVEKMTQHREACGFGPEAPWMEYANVPSLGFGPADLSPQDAFARARLVLMRSDDPQLAVPSDTALLQWFEKRPEQTAEVAQ